jgi:hypothetical protein
MTEKAEAEHIYRVNDRVSNSYTEELGTVRAVSDHDPSLPLLFWVRMDDGYYVTCYASDLEPVRNER